MKEKNNIKTAIEAAKKRLIKAGFSEEVAGKVEHKALAEVFGTAEYRNQGILLSGVAGVGKTYAVECYFGKRLRDKRVDCFRGIDLDRVSESANFLFFDDLGTDLPFSEYGVMRDPFAEFVQNWYRAKNRPRLIITTNLTGKELQERYGDRILSRLLNTCITYRIKGKDKRILPTREIIEEV